MGRSEKIIIEMDQLASEDHSHVATQEEIDVYRGNWWIRSNVVNFDTMPTRRQPDFKKALSTLHRLKKAEDKTHYENWSHSTSSWWQWQTTWWDPHYETSPQRLSEPTIHLWHESQQEFDAKKNYRDYIGNSQRSLPSPTGCVKRIPPDTAIHEQNGYEKVYNDNNILKTSVDNSDMTYTDKHKHNMREV